VVVAKNEGCFRRCLKCEEEMESTKNKEGNVLLELMIDVPGFEDALEEGRVEIPVAVDGLDCQQRQELHLLKNSESLTQLCVDLVDYKYDTPSKKWFQSLNKNLESYHQGAVDPLQQMILEYLDQRSAFRNEKKQEHEAKREEFAQLPIKDLVCYSNSIGIGPYVRVSLGEHQGEATLNRTILNEMRPFFSDTSIFLAKFQQARLLAEQHNEALAEKLLELWSADKHTQKSGRKNEQNHFEDVELIVEFDDEFQVA